MSLELSLLPVYIPDCKAIHLKVKKEAIGHGKYDKSEMMLAADQETLAMKGVSNFSYCDVHNLAQLCAGALTLISVKYKTKLRFAFNIVC